jgi:hypothetical protein
MACLTSGTMHVSQKAATETGSKNCSSRMSRFLLHPALAMLLGVRAASLALFRDVDSRDQTDSLPSLLGSAEP